MHSYEEAPGDVRARPSVLRLVAYLRYLKHLYLDCIWIAWRDLVFLQIWRFPSFLESACSSARYLFLVHSLLCI